MPIVIATTTITVTGHRPQLDIDPDDDDIIVPEITIATGVRAAITLPNGERRAGNVDERDSYALRCDTFAGGLSRYDTVTDETTGIAYSVVSAVVSQPTFLGLRHVKATLEVRKGLTSSEPSSA